MAIRDIVLLGDAVLREPAEEVTEFGAELKRLVRDMYETMYHAEGIGLAAPQIGVRSRVIVVDLRREGSEGEGGQPVPARVALVNPRITWQSADAEKQSEGCLSIPGLEEVVSRPVAVRVEALDPEGEPVEIEAEDLFARALQHEIDHIDGVLFIDRVSPIKRKMLLKKWKKLEAEQHA